MKLKIKDFIIKNAKWIILFVCIIGFLAITENVWNKEIMRADIIGYKVISTILISNFITPIAKLITNFGGAIFLISETIILLIVVKNKKIGLSVALNLIIITILNILLKNIIQRPRPTEFRLIDETGYSFPSGHSMVSMAFYGFIIYLVYKKVQNKYIKWIVISILSILIILIGISRIYLGVHFASDVLGGFACGMVFLVTYIKINRDKIIKDLK